MPLIFPLSNDMSQSHAAMYVKKHRSHRNHRYHHIHNRYKPKRYHLTLSIRNHNVTEAKFFRLVGVDNTVDFNVAPGKIFTNTYEVNRKGYWTLFVEFPGDRYAKSPRKIISRDSYSHWIMEVYYYPDSVGFSEWHKMHKILYN
ncbi:hypothetical protein DdX_04748 [Ditylenchus destructor]|uniref:Uncharacterized protein n=1 Tax=Ditylenchus destructor TaxID=166010 RepID=A0AAD4N6X7_9BILA|nr:hypothetical protein DdX_04748 [Ditylenchus destructor]